MDLIRNCNSLWLDKYSSGLSNTSTETKGLTVIDPTALITVRNIALNSRAGGCLSSASLLIPTVQLCVRQRWGLWRRQINSTSLPLKILQISKWTWIIFICIYNIFDFNLYRKKKNQWPWIGFTTNQSPSGWTWDGWLKFCTKHTYYLFILGIFII